MTSPKKSEANRKNARKSAGPRTSEGKAVVARNAIRHGLLSDETLMPGEEADIFESLRESLWTE